MRVGFVEWPEDLQPVGPLWTAIARSVDQAQLDLLVTNELPFGRWLPELRMFNREAARKSIDIHEDGIIALHRLAVPAILSSRPRWQGNRLVNEAVILESGAVRPVHLKHYLPDEPGWYETTWFDPMLTGFQAAQLTNTLIGVMLCTDAMFNEHARSYGRQGTSLIAIPRATGLSVDTWLAAVKMAAIVSGSYVVSSNRSKSTSSGVAFGGCGFAFLPNGDLFATTTKDGWLQTVDVDLAVSAKQRQLYPCYVQELNTKSPYPSTVPFTNPQT